MRPSSSTWRRAQRGLWSLALLALATLSQAQTPTAEPSATPAAAASPADATKAARALPAETFFRQPQVLQAQLSPDGRKLAVTSSRGAQRVGLIIFDLEGKQPPTRAALFNDVDIANVRWLGNDQLVFDSIDLESGSGLDQREAPGLFIVQADGKELRALIQRRSALVVDSAPVARRALPRNHVLLQVPRQGPGVQPDEVLVGRLGRDEVQPLWLNVRTLRTRSADFDAPDGGARRWMFDSSGRARLAWQERDGKRFIWWRNVEARTWQLLAEHVALHAPFTPRFVDDAGNLYVTRSVGPEGYAVLTRYDFDKRAPENDPWVRVQGFDFVGSLIAGTGEQSARGVRVEAETETTVWLDPALQKLQQQVDDKLPGRINRLTCRRCTASDAVVLVESWSDRDPGQILLHRPGRDQWQRIAYRMDGIDPSAMARVDFERIAARDGRQLPVWLTMPIGVTPGKPAPAVVMVHGGPWVRGGHWRWQAMEQFLASRGWLVISPDFRGSTGYGAAHFRAGWKQWGQAMQDDVADALLWARKQGLADPQRACIAGASYGGYATLMGLVRHPELYRCGVAWAAVTDPLLYLEGSFWVRDDISDAGRRYSLPEMVGDAQRDAERLKSVSPVEQAARIKAPLLLAFGESDLRVPLAHGERLRAAMRKAGLEPEWVTYPDEAHGWRKPENQLDWARRMEAFLARHLLAPADAAAPQPAAAIPR